MSHRTHNRKVAPGAPYTCGKCGATTVASESGDWKCRPCIQRRKKERAKEFIESHPEIACVDCKAKRRVNYGSTLRCRPCEFSFRLIPGNQLRISAAARTAGKRKEIKLEGDVTPIALWELYIKYDGRCAYCSSPILRVNFDKMRLIGFDHVVPFASGGKHDIGNIVPCCRPCNHEKGRSVLSTQQARQISVN